MFSAAGKGERRSVRGSARLSSKMSGRLPRLRALRPRPQHQRRARTDAVAVDATTLRPQGNLKGAAASHEVEHDAKRYDAKKGEDTAGAVSKAREMDEDDNDEELTMTTVADVDEEEEEEETILDGNVDVDVDVDVALNTEETIDVEANEQASYECKTCEPSKTLPSIKAYFEHLRKEHKYKVKLLRGLPFLPDFYLLSLSRYVFHALVLFKKIYLFFPSLSLSPPHLSLSLYFFLLQTWPFLKRKVGQTGERIPF